MLAPFFIVSPVAVTVPSVVPTFEHTFPLPILELQARRLAGLPGTQPWLFHSDGPPFRFFHFWTFEILRLCAPGHGCSFDIARRNIRSDRMGASDVEC